MTEQEFLARWSRRKRASKSDAPPAETAEPAGEASVPCPGAEAEPDVDLGSLPPIDAITAATDVTAFLRKGVPQELMHMALRRAWSADPAIRDFIGLAENAWDFNDPNAMPGFGPLDCSQAELAAWVDRIVGGLRNAAEALPDTPTALQESSDLPSADLVHTALLTEEPAQAVITETAASVAPQPTTEAHEVRRRTHGGALPR
ncbi:DUF3306 domain-containing protein [Bradyrhizobium diazoefficiens]|uniref:DUF3306 domain-containing protein n=1 Tax=Bradyrhizobium diazoefficiens TaxID=1355477 RepID=UPI00190E417D|nr:DUF3306 domain-containing protein [Bradyrhizobium diazoefficiens]QQO31875.1 DUF3306 domain-containing protein [Bradyrhizobium diazoefficiens]